MINKLKEIVIWSFTLSLITSYFACFGYYSFFHIDITTFLSVEDLTTIFVKWIWISVVPMLLIVFVGYTIFKRIGTEGSWWDGRLGKTIFRKRIVLDILILLVLVFGSLLYKPFRDILVTAFGIGLSLIVIPIAILAFVLSNIMKKKQVKDISIIHWVSVLTSSYILIFLAPLLIGSIAATKMTPDNVKVQFENDSILNTADSSNIVYIGKTTDYFFLYDKNTMHTTAYSMDKVKKYEVIPTIVELFKNHLGN